MADENGDGTVRGFVRWAMKPPQAYVIYLIALVLVGGLSFYAGSLKPKLGAYVVPQSAVHPAAK
ncbi:MULTISPECIES: hypothetical protein [Rhodopseudomonas]|uniref:Uncharacterized protein n=1 Tax=Rhodopseudomonas palustris TaxID=1076 RepID=A0A0D7F8E8_RHOPL|nr:MULTISPECIES: hypothetical protein [Rhodopseudomonas]KIZ47992.1 hypothetical protein OO17_01450 [Rhodopseudomonas palustris]MDF3811100.1 hypothetical protein [Rhodopseudomonas sp. BAL398]WOK19200.1 hypothetical protein RBJ75_06695 [Rhodopseudomonas sp. BAL398]